MEDIHAAAAASSRTPFSIQHIQNVFKTNPHLDENTIVNQEALKNPLCDKCIGWATLTNFEAKQELTVRRHNDDGIENEKNERLKLASSAMEELWKLGQVNGPLWSNNIEGGESLNFGEYESGFCSCLGLKPVGFVSEGSRATSVVSMSSVALVEALLDAEQWRDMFVGIIGSCTTVNVISPGTGDDSRINGVVQLMKAEIHLITPLVPVRLLKFIRFTKRLADGVWGVVDVSVDTLPEGGYGTRRMPSGCIIHDMPNGFSKVTWIEHTQYNECLVPVDYRGLVRCGLGFGAQRWISALLRHCESIQTTTSTATLHILHDKTRKRVKELAKSMTSIFCEGVCLTGGQQWDWVYEAPTRPRIMARKYLSHVGEALGVMMNATYSVRIPARHRQVLDVLLRLESRGKWDLMYHRLAESCRFFFSFNIANELEDGPECPDCISILNPNEENQSFVLQESTSDTTRSLIVYATVDFQFLIMVLSASVIPPHVSLLPSGISIVPYYGEGRAQCGSIVTVTLQILLPNQSISDITKATIVQMNQLVSGTILGIQEIVRADRSTRESS